MKAYFYTLVAIVFATFSLTAQTVWLGNTDSDWQNSDNWSAGIPTSGMTITIPGNPAGGNFPVFSGGPIIDYTIQNAGTLTFNSLVYNNGTIINFGGGTINNDGDFFNAGMGVFDNDGILNNNAVFTNYGTFDLALSGGVNVAVGATFTHAGLFFKAAGPFMNYGTTINTSNMRSTNVFENFGTLENKNSFESPFGSVFKNHTNGTISNPSGSILVVNGEFTNNAPFTNGGEFQIQSATIGTSTAIITNNGMFDVSGSLVNESSIINNSTLAIKDGGTLTNNNTVTNNGTITLSICGALVQNANNTIVAPIQNDGLIYLLNGDVEWTNVEFGNEFTNINSTKPPVAGCLPGIFVSLDANGEATVQASQVDKGSYGSCGASLSSVTIDKTNYTEADLGSNLVTLTVVDNIGISSSCQSIVTILPYVAPIIPVDNSEITFECPEDVLVSTLPGATTAVASWTTPTDVSSTCVGAAPCVTRQATNTTQCNSGQVYGFYLKLEGVNNHYAISNGTLEEYEDGSALYTATATNNSNSDYTFDLSFNLTGRTFTAPGAPKDHSCLNVNTSDWYYYTGTTGTASGTGLLAGASISFTRIGEAFQIGVGANATSTTNTFGGSGWLDGNIVSQPTNGPVLTRFNNSNPQFGDINIMLSGDGNECRPLPQCSNQDAIPGFIFMGEFNDSKYYCSNTNNYTWAEAKALAESNGGHLAIANDAAENNFIATNILADWAWLGLTDEAHEGTFIDVFGNTPSYFNWNAGEPNNSGGNENYVRILKSNGKWTDRNAHFEAEVVMEIPCSNAPPAGQDCTNVPNNISGYTLIGELNNSKYYISNASSTWDDAKAHAENSGGSLVVINDAAENSFIADNINSNVWVGLNDIANEGNFVWSNGDALTYTNWNSGEPNDYGTGEDVVELLSSGRWNDNRRTGTRKYVLEINCSNGNGAVNPPVITQIGGPQNGDAFAVGITEVAYEVTDDCGNQEICIFEVTVDQTPSEITFNNCPGDITINTEAGATSAPVTWNPVTASTTCYNDGLEVEQALGPNIGSIQRVKDGPQLVVYNAIDSCGNFNTCSFNVTVVATPSSITMAGCSGDVTEIAAPGATSAAVSWVAPTGTTDCFTGVVNVNQLEGPASGSDFAVGTSTRIIYLVSDECGNTEICIFNVSVQASCFAAGTPCDDGDDTTIDDQEDGNCNCVGTPSSITVVDCGNDLVFNTEPGESVALVSFQSPGFSTNCPAGTSGMIQQISGGASGTNYPIGITTVEFTFSDNCGNFESCSFDVTVVGVACTDMDGDGVCVAEDCDDNDPSLPATPGTACDDGDATTDNDVIGVDGCSCSGTPIGILSLECPADILLDPVPGNLVTFTWPEPTVSTSCSSGGLTITQIEGPDRGTQLLASSSTNNSGYTITYEATDACGNSETCSFVVTEQFWFATFEYVNCPTDITVEGTSADGAIVNYDQPELVTDCPAGASNNLATGLESGSIFPIGTTQVVYQSIGVGVGNGCGGGTTCVFNVTVTEPSLCSTSGGDADGDGICAADDCDDNDPNLPAVQGTACDDGDATTENDVIGADGCSCEGTTIDQCAAAGGDADGDGICAADDCNDNDPNLPAAQGTTCDDGDASTENDVIGADGCSCAGTTIDPCAAAGGDADGDGICAADDCDDNDPNLPAAQGTTCDDGDATTENDVIGADGCSCAGTPISSEPDCTNINVEGGIGELVISGLNAPITSVQVFNSNWQEEFKCFANCDAPIQLVDGLTEGTYFVKVAFYTSSYQFICAIEDFYQVLGGDPCTAAGGDADGDGICAADDCDDNDPNLPAAVGSACDDGDAGTENDVIGADGCSCAGTDIPTPVTCASYQISNVLPECGPFPAETGVLYRRDCGDSFEVWAAGSDLVLQELSDGTATITGTILNDGSVGTVNLSLTGYNTAGENWSNTCYNDNMTTDYYYTSFQGTVIVDGITYTLEQKASGVDFVFGENAHNQADGEFGFGAWIDGSWGSCVEMFGQLAPLAPGDACDDGDASTVNDQIGADGCTCAGVSNDPCAAAGGDADGDGVCAADDCDDNDPSLPAIAGTSCDDGDSNTTNDEIQADGCTCEGITSGPDCGNVSIVADAGFITVSNLDEAPISSVQIFDASWNEAFKCAGDCNATEVVNNLTPGTYFVKVALYTASWQPICSVEDYYTVTNGSGDPCAAFGGDADGDGVCADLDCDDNDPNFPMAVGTACDDGNPETVQDAILADGCTCEGKIHNPTGTDCSDITITSGDASLTVDGLDGAPITSIQIFDHTWNQVFKCAGDCEPSTQIVDGLASGTYFVKVSFYDNAWQLQCSQENFYEVVGSTASPRRILDFNAQKGPRQVELMWGSNTGMINDFFTIERSEDGVNYEELFTVNNRFENDDFNTYVEKDLQPLSGANYYRMKQVYDDGTYVYSGERLVIFEGDFSQFSIFPNPTSDQVYVHLKSFSGLPVTIEFYDALGIKVMERDLRAAPEVPLPFSTTELNEGTYIISIKYQNKKMVSERLVIIKE